MTEPVFGPAYAAAYDQLYEEKDYEGECDLLERIFRRYSVTEVRRILDLGCGTGGHALVLAKRGYAVTGVDRSAAMLRHARTKADQIPSGNRPVFLQSDIAGFRTGELFDAVVMMFAVLGYQPTYSGVLDVLRAARAAVDPGGVLVFDIWFGPAVLRQGPSARRREIARNGQRIVRVSSGSLQTDEQVCVVEMIVTCIGPGDAREESAEEHRVRYFFPDEIGRMLGEAGFELVRIGAFPDIDRDADESTWNAGVVARAV